VSQVRTEQFRQAAVAALKDDSLRHALGNVQGLLVGGRAQAVAAMPEFEALRDRGKAIRDHTLAHLDLYLARFADAVERQGGTVHWAATAEEACQAIVAICRAEGAQTVAKSKSMVSEEIGLNEALSQAGMRPVETDLGEYIIQLRDEPPSHIIAPAVHLNREQIAETFHEHHRELAADRDIADPAALLAEARAVLRRDFLNADIGITGANFLVAETGSAIVVTNEGNADLSMTLPRTHIVLTGIEKLAPSLDDAATLLRLLVRSATGQAVTSYTTIVGGPRRPGDPDGPEKFHVVLVDNGRTKLLGSANRPMLACIRCGACLNHCPVYGAIGGHAYGWVYPGPMGSVLTPSLVGLHQSGDLPNASTVCGRCDSVCPVRIPLTAMMRRLRERQFEARENATLARWALKSWAMLATRPTLYRMVSRLAARGLRGVAAGRGRLARLPFAGGWTRHRDLPTPAGETFAEQWRKRSRS
jgi:L-lactate dehydrogenase complex protein LldF